MNLYQSFHIKAALLLATLCAVSCGPPEPGIWKNQHIDADKRAHFRKMNDEAFKYLYGNDEKQLETLMSGEVIENSATLRQVERISNHLHADKYQLLDEYYIVNKNAGNNRIPPATTGLNSYWLEYQAPVPEMYFAFYIPKTGDNKWMISTLWFKFNYGWKIASLDLGRYTINGHTAPELFEAAKQKYSSGHLVDALNTVSLASQCSKPSESWTYDNDAEIDNLNNKLLSEANSKYPFPVTLAELPGQPQIVSVFNQEAPEGYFPAIYYITHINIKDTAAVRKENERMQKIVGKLIPGIDQDRKYIFYSAFNKHPSSMESVPHFDMIQKIQ